jgi:hypothetical protein
VKADVSSCTGAFLERVRRSITIAPDGATSSGREVMVMRVPAELRTRAKIVTRYAGILDGPAPEPPPLRKPLPDCSSLELRCHID